MPSIFEFRVQGIPPLNFELPTEKLSGHDKTSISTNDEITHHRKFQSPVNRDGVIAKNPSISADDEITHCETQPVNNDIVIAELYLNKTETTHHREIQPVNHDIVIAELYLNSDSADMNRNKNLDDANLLLHFAEAKTTDDANENIVFCDPNRTSQNGPNIINLININRPICNESDRIIHKSSDTTVNSCMNERINKDTNRIIRNVTNVRYVQD